MAASAWHQASGAAARKEVFEPPRAAALPPAVVEQWRRNVRFREAVRAVGRQTVVAAGVAALYFGAEAGVRVARVPEAERGAGGGMRAAALAGQGGSAPPPPPQLLPQVVGQTDGLSSGIAGMLSGAALGRMGELLMRTCQRGLSAASPVPRERQTPNDSPPQTHPKTHTQTRTVPSPSPGRTTLSGALVGGLLGFVSGAAQAKAARWAADAQEAAATAARE
jgi:hypothetical protein